MLAAVFGLLTLLTKASPISLLVALIASTLLAVAPVYLFIMPNLNGGEGQFQERKGQETTRPGRGEEGNTSSKRGLHPVRRKDG